MFLRIFFLAILALILTSSIAQPNLVYDIVLTGGRVIDPETKLDAIRNVGIINNRIAEISSVALKGKEMVDVTGLVVSPGFIDLHVHGRTNQEQEYQLHDGVTTALELEWGIEFLSDWYASRKSKALINYGASVCWPFERFKAMDKYKQDVSLLYQKAVKGESGIEAVMNAVAPGVLENQTTAEMEKTLTNIRSSLSEGGIGIGVPIGYLPNSRAEEMFSVFKLAGEMDALVYTHVRYANILSIQEVVANAVLTGAPLHIVHINSMSLGQIQLALDIVQDAKKKGFMIAKTHFAEQGYRTDAGAGEFQQMMKRLAH